jgi:hypothetical protein
MLNYDLIEFDDLNEDLKIVATDLGIDSARLLMAELPGINLQIPFKFDVSNNSIKVLVSRLGEERARHFQECLQGLSLYIPVGFPIRFAKRFISEHFTGDNSKELAIELKLSERSFYDLIKNVNRSVHDDDNERHLFSEVL